MVNSTLPTISPLYPQQNRHRQVIDLSGIWNFADFKNGQGIIRMGGMNHKGVFARDRCPKMAAHFLRERWTRG